MAVSVGINGLGRIGKMVFRLIFNSTGIEVVHINDPMDNAILVHLLKYDSIHGKFNAEIEDEKAFIKVNGRRIRVTHEETPAAIPWDESSVDQVIESSGQYKTREKLEPHLRKGVKKIILTCPPDDDSIDRTVVMGVNEEQIRETDRIISNASCTTNCVALMLKVLNDSFGVTKAFMNTVHPYTNNQMLLDGPHKDFRRARAAALNIIPTTSSAVRSVCLVMPEMRHRFDGFATRVPVPDGSFVELTAHLKKKVNPEIIRSTFRSASEHRLKDLLEYSEDHLVSSDIINNPHSAVFDALSTKVIDQDFVQLLAWYDNESGYSNRILDVIKYIGNVHQSIRK